MSPGPDLPSAWITSIAIALAVALLIGGLLLLRHYRRTVAKLALFQQYSQVIDGSSNSLILMDTGMQITLVNGGFCRLTGYTQDEVLRRRPAEFLGSGDGPMAGLEFLVRGREVHKTEYLVRRKDGSSYWTASELRAMFGAANEHIGFVEVGRDISASKERELDLARSIMVHHSLLDTIHRHAIVSVADPAGLIIDANAAFTAISGYSREELLGQPHRIVNSGHHPPEFWRALWAAISSGKSWQGEICNRNKNGQLYWVKSIIAPMLDEAGSVMQYISIRTDITAAKRAWQDLAEQRERLARIIDGTHAGTWEWNEQTGEAHFNERWADIMGRKLADLGPLHAQSWQVFVHADDLPRAADLLARHCRGESDFFECELRLLHASEQWVWGQMHGRLYQRDAQGNPTWIAGTLLDISARKRSEEALLRKQAALDRSELLAALGGWELDLRDGDLQWSEETYRLHEVAPGTQISLAQALSYFAPPDRARLQEAMDRAVQPHEAWDMELPLHTARGRVIWVRSVGEASIDDGGVRRIVGTYQDITARRSLEAQSQRNHEVLLSVVENMPCALSVFDADLNLRAHNSKFIELMGFPPALFEQVPTRFETLIRFNAARGEYDHEPDVEAYVQRLIELARQPTVHQFERQLTSGKTVEVRDAPMPGGGFVTTYVDISERKRGEAELRRAEAILRGAIDAVNEAFVLYDPDDRLVFCNEKYRQLYASSADLIVPGALFEDIIREGARRGQYVEAVGREEAWVAQRLAAHRQGNTLQVQKLDDGRWTRLIEHRMEDGHSVGFRIDITDLMRANEAAEEAARSKGQFLANMSHEIRTPMNAILGLLRLLQRTELSQRQHDYASKTEAAARSLLGLLNDILDFSKVEAGKMSLDPQPMRSEQLFRDLAVILSANVGAKPIDILFDLDPALPPVVVADQMRLQQVLINLGGNATKFTAEGEVVIAVRVLPGQPGDAQETVRLAFSVSDSGIGIAPEHQAKIFSGFSQAEASTTRRYGGTGLGLAISQRLVQLMGGSLALDSELGRGSRFHFELTLGVPAAIADASPPPSVDAALANRPCLILDQAGPSRDLLARMAEELGLTTVLLAASTTEALARLQTQAEQGQAIGLVLSDWRRPAGPDGFELLRHLRHLRQQGAALAQPLVLMVSGQSREELMQRSAEEQAELDGYLVKPITRAMLLEAIEAAGQAEDQPAGSTEAPSRSAHARPLQDVRVLVVEDNPNNQQVAQELLEDAGARVQLAGNGQVAVDLLRASPAAFDIVLMDVQMPVMDGYSATRLIRQELQLTRLPIIAMTANVMASDREQCLAAGMNAHVGKPFDMDHLVRVILQQMAGAEAPQEAAMKEPQEPQEPPERRFPTLAVPLALSERALALGFELQAAMDRFMGKAELFQRTAQSFSKSALQLPAQLKAQLAAGNLDEAVQLSHSFKGLAATLGAVKLAALGAEAEAAFKRGEPPDAAWLDALEVQISSGCGHLSLLAQDLRALQSPPAV
ncbi:PAS domain S-box protein [Paucibacter sp. KCTC 42545]|uniref:PAS domain S-box protein n=1 Tax=Paucibacter sp. KCTC 42545 TaxID=1768242 RepID=UPI0018D254D1|nr:PAS domain S-box protein [Paucibacter sp. KCTC 42545]